LAGNGETSDGRYSEALRELGEALSELKRERGAPSYDRIRARGVKVIGTTSALSKASMSEMFAGRRGPASLDRLLWLVRTMLSYDDGEEGDPIERRDPRLQPWRKRWHTLEALRADARRRTSVAEDAGKPHTSAPETAVPVPSPPEVVGTSRPNSASPWLDKPRRSPLEILHDLPTPAPAEATEDTAVTSTLEPTASRSEQEASTYEPRTSSPTNIFASLGDPLTGHDGPIHSVAFSPDGRLLATGSRDKTVQLWAQLAGPPLGAQQAALPLAARAVLYGMHCGRPSTLGAPLHSPADVRAVAFSPDGNLIATGGADETIRLWDAATRTLLGAPLTGHTDRVTSVAFFPDGNLLASAAAHDAEGPVRLWDPFTRISMGGLATGHTDGVWSVTFSPDGRLLATGSLDETVRLWDPATCTPIGEPLTGHTGGVASVAFSSDGRLLATVAAAGSPDETVRLWDAATRTPLGAPLTGHTDRVVSVAFSPDGRLLATGSLDETVRLWDPDTRTPIGEPLTGHNGWISSVAFSPDGRLHATGGAGGTVRLWDPATRTPLGAPLTGHTDRVASVAFSPDSSVLAVASGTKVLLYA
jgi:WD40 repeat protein